MSVGAFLHLDTGVFLIGDVMQENQCVCFFAEIKGRHFIDWIKIR